MRVMTVSRRLPEEVVAPASTVIYAIDPGTFHSHTAALCPSELFLGTFPVTFIAILSGRSLG